jgi:hypothetical protein
VANKFKKKNFIFIYERCLDLRTQQAAMTNDNDKKKEKRKKIAHPLPFV